MTALAFVTEQTGELVAPDDGAALTVRVLETYADAKAELEVLRLRREARLAQIVTADPELSELLRQERELANQVDEVEARLADVFSDATRKRHRAPITLDVGRVRVTWGKPRTRWTQRVKPEAIAKRDPKLAEELGIREVVDSPPAPRITVRVPEL